MDVRIIEDRNQLLHCRHLGLRDHQVLHLYHTFMAEGFGDRCIRRELEAVECRRLRVPLRRRLDLRDADLPVGESLDDINE